MKEKVNRIENEEFLRQDRLHKMKNNPVEQLVCKMALPSIIGMLITALYNMADAYFVGKINNKSTAAVGIVFSFMNIVQAFGFLFGHGSGNYMARKIGKKDWVAAYSMAATGFVFSFISGIILAVFVFFFLNPVICLLGATQGLREATKEYLVVIAVGAPFMMSAFTLNNQYRLQGNVKIGMIGITIGGILNLFLDPVFIFGFGMGLRGAGIATVISQIISMIFLLFFSNKKGNIGVVFRKVSLDLALLKEMIAGGMPNFCRQGIASVATACLNQAAGYYGGEVAIAAFTVTNRVTMIAGSAMIGLGQGFQPVCGINYGAGLKERVKKAFWFCIKLSTIFLCICTLIVGITAPSIIKLFRDDIQVIEIGSQILRFQCISFPFLGWVIMVGMFLQNIGKFTKATIVSAARQGIFFLPLIYILPRMFGLIGVELAQPIAEICTFGIALYYGIIELKKLTSK